MKLDAAKAKESWTTAGLNPQGVATINAWIDQLAKNIEAGHGRWDAYAKNAYYTGADPMGSVQILKSTVDQTSK